MPTQHICIATLLGATCCVRLATVLRCVATCWVLLAQVWNRSNLSQQHPTCRNMSQHGGQTHATCCAQQCCDMCCVGMLRSFGRGLKKWNVCFYTMEPSRYPHLVIRLLVYVMAPGYALQNKAVWLRRNTFCGSMSKSYSLISCQGRSQDFSKGGHTGSYRGYSPDCHLNIVGCLLTKRLTKGGGGGGHGHPRTPLATPLSCKHWQFMINCNLFGCTKF